MAIGSPVGSAFLDVVPQIGSGFQAAIASKVNPMMGGIGTAAGGVMSGAMAGALAAGGAVIAGGLAAGVGLFKIGETFDEAFDSIRVGTGAVGAELEGLKEDFKAVFASVPADAGTVGQAITILNQRLGLTGGQLQGTAEQFIELSRITGTDLTANIEGVTRVFGDWGITLDDQGERLDQLFRANQQTGIGIDQLAQSLVKFGAPLRQLGFSFDQSAALISKFEQEGVNAELVLGSMRIALGRMAKAGEPAQETFQRVVESIENAGSASEANRLALELFGARAGPDMAAAIREGRFEIEALYQEIGFGSDTIAQASGDTQDFAEKWDMFKNRVLVALEPVATRVFEAIGTLIDKIGPPIEKWINGVLIPAIDNFAAWWDENGPRVMEIAGMVAQSIGNAFRVIGEVIGAVVKILQGVVDFVFGVFSGDWSRAWQGVKKIFGGVWDAIKAVVVGALNNVLIFFGDFMADTRETVGKGINNIVTFFKELPGRILTWLKELPGKMLQFGKDLAQGILNGLGNLAADMFNKLKGAIGDAINNVQKFFGFGSPSRVMAKVIGLPLAQGIVQGFEQGLDSDAMLSATRRAVGTISAAAPAISLQATGTDGPFAGSAAAMPTTVVISLDADGKEKLAEFVVDWGNRRVRQITRAG